MRVAGYGRIARDRPIAFRFDGRAYSGYHGDTLASALLARGVRLFARSFKYHRPRGVMTDGAHEPNALVRIGCGAQALPNQRATTQELYEGLEAFSQNRWPGLRTDIGALNDLGAPFLAAGFYYKTFMWPAGFWQRIYEPLIRRAAGIGTLAQAPDRRPHDKAWAHCDVLVIGAGPAGLMAALKAAHAGADVILADENPFPGGRLAGEDEVIDGQPAAAWVSRVCDELEACGTVRIMRRTTVLGVYDQGTYSALERVAHSPDAPAERPHEIFWRIVARRSILCTGALERPMAFPGNDRPGVMLASAVRGYLHRYGVVPGRRVAVFANNDDGWRTARDLRAAGVEVVALIDARAQAHPGAKGAPEAASAVGGAAGGGDDFEVLRGALVSATRGRHGLRAIRLDTPDGVRWLKADCLAISGGWNPTLHLSGHLGAKPVWNDSICAFVPPSASAPGAVPGMEVAGAAAGVFSTKGALKSGAYRAKLTLDSPGLPTPSGAIPQADNRVSAPGAIWSAPGRGRAFVDFQNDVTVGDIAQAAREGFSHAEHMKRYTTLGMAPDQGKTANVTALAILAEATGRSLAQNGTTTFRPPYAPVGIAAMGAGGGGRGFAPVRRSPCHRGAADRGAAMTQAGLWYRPAWFPAPGERTWRQACDREVAMVRRSVGVCDVSTLGKIEVFGSDASDFLDLVYTNTMSALPEGRVRYGLMLREDGMVLDDGTCARLGPAHFVVTTTTDAAAQVLSHLEFAARAYCPGRDIRLLDATDHWAQIAVTGPLSGRVVDAVLDDPPGQADQPGQAFSFMACARVGIGGVAGRVFRIGFTGELGYELAVPARYGESLFRLLLGQAETLGGGAFGLEALNVLRLEKGFLTHAEINGRVTAHDLGLGGLHKRTGDFIGRRMAARPALNGPGRMQLVGLKVVGAVRQLAAGAHLFEPGAEITHENALGHVTSAAYSPTLGRTLALALVADGRARIGARLRMVDHVRALDTLCEVTPGVAFDPEGRRMRG